MAKDLVCGVETVEKKVPAKSQHMGKTYFIFVLRCAKGRTWKCPSSCYGKENLVFITSPGILQPLYARGHGGHSGAAKRETRKGAGPRRPFLTVAE